MTKSGIVVEIDSKDPDRVKTDTCPGKFRKVLEICIRHSTSMISNDVVTIFKTGEGDCFL